MLTETLTRSFTVDSSGSRHAARRRVALLAAAAGLPVLVGAESVTADNILFDTRPLTDTASGVADVVQADIDGDGDTDIISTGAGSVVLWLNDGAAEPTFTVQNFPVLLNTPRALFVADVNGDGALDVLTCQPGGDPFSPDDTVSWFENDGGSPPVLTARTIASNLALASDVSAADADGDGDLDVFAVSGAAIVGGELIWYENDGNDPPVFTSRQIDTATNLRSVIATDLDGDGDTDLATTRSGVVSEVSWYENDGALPPVFTKNLISDGVIGGNNFPQFFSNPVDVAAGDIDGDGLPDLVSVHAAGDVVLVHRNTGAAPLFETEFLSFNMDDSPQSVDLADVDGDGDLDVVAGLFAIDTVVWYENPGTALPVIFERREIAADRDAIVAVAAADFDGDGDIDVASAGQGTGPQFLGNLAWHANLGPAGACCFGDGTCTDGIAPADCLAMTGIHSGIGTTCATVTCTAGQRGCGSGKGSLVVFTKVELRWDAAGNPKQDTFIELSNDYPADTRVQLYFVNGDAPLAADPDTGERAHTGWNWVDNVITLTANQPAYWSVRTGGPGALGSGSLSPFSVLDPGLPPGRPADDGTTDRVLRGYVLAWAVDNFGSEKRWNHLSGHATLLDDVDGTAWQYDACTFKTVDNAFENGDTLGTPGDLMLDGLEYERVFDLLVVNFQASGSMGWSGANVQVTTNTDLTLMPLEIDLRQETDGPVTTKASFDVWNENEVKFSGAHRCVTCWDQQLLSLYDAPNHFTRMNLQTDGGTARIDGLQSQNCDLDFDPVDGAPLGADPRDIMSQDAPLLGVVAKHLSFNGVIAAAAGTTVHGMGFQDGRIEYDSGSGPGGGGPPEANRPTFDPGNEDHVRDLIERMIIEATNVGP